MLKLRLRRFSFSFRVFLFVLLSVKRFETVVKFSVDVEDVSRKDLCTSDDLLISVFCELVRFSVIPVLCLSVFKFGFEFSDLFLAIEEGVLNCCFP